MTVRISLSIVTTLLALLTRPPTPSNIHRGR